MKNNILKKAQNENRDEREEMIKTKAFHIGWICVSLVMLLLIIIRGINNESANDIMMILMAQTSAVLFYQYVSIPTKKSYLVYGIIALIGFLLAFASLLSSYMVY